MFATWFGSETVLGASSEFVQHGLLGVVEDPLGAALCLFLVGLIYARPLYRLNILTFSDFFRIRFSRRTELLSVFFLVPSYFSWIAAQLLAMGLLLESLLGMPLSVGVVLCTAIVVLYTYLGGMWAVSITDFVQTVIIVVGLLVVAVSLVGEAGGLQVVLASQPKGFFNFLPENDWGAWLNYLAAWITIGLGSIPQQDVFQRLMSSRSERVAVMASFTGAGMYLVVAALPLVIALAGKVLHPEMMGSDLQTFLPNLMLQHASSWLQILFFGALLSAILSTASGAILAPATVLGENLLRPNLRELKPAEFLMVMRLCVVLVAFVSAVMALMQNNIYDLVAQSSALSLVSLFVPLTAGLFWKPSNEWGALLSMVMGMFVWILWEVTGWWGPALIWGLLASIVGLLLGWMIQSKPSHSASSPD